VRLLRLLANFNSGLWWWWRAAGPFVSLRPKRQCPEIISVDDGVGAAGVMARTRAVAAVGTEYGGLGTGQGRSSTRERHSGTRGENCVIRAFIICIIVQPEYVHTALRVRVRSLPGYRRSQQTNRPTRAGGSWQEANRTKGEEGWRRLARRALLPLTPFHFGIATAQHCQAESARAGGGHTDDCSSTYTAPSNFNCLVENCPCKI
jgi:hypothetical protein